MDLINLIKIDDFVTMLLYDVGPPADSAYCSQTSAAFVYEEIRCVMLFYRKSCRANYGTFALAHYILLHLRKQY